MNRALSNTSSRFSFLDALRGLAALLVVLAHAGYHLSPAFARWSAWYLDVGNVGVIVFFGISGFVIPLSLESSASLWRFWVRRVCRLYPLYWCAVIIMLGCAAAGLAARFELGPDLLQTQQILLNLTLLQGLTGQPALLNQSWTLGYELLFYAVVSLFWLGRVQQRSVANAVLAVTLALVLQGIVPRLLHVGLPVDLLSFPALMCAGTVGLDWYRGRVTQKAALGVLCITLVMLVATASTWAFISARLLGVALFCVALVWRPAHIWRPLLTLGRISYSIYLLHPFVIGLVPALVNPIITAIVWIAVTIVIALATERWVERPMIDLGRRLTRTRPQPQPALAR